MIPTSRLAFVLPLLQLVFCPLYSLGTAVCQCSAGATSCSCSTNAGSNGSVPIGAIIGGVFGTLGLVILFCVLRAACDTNNRRPPAYRAVETAPATERRGMPSVSRTRTLDGISIIDEPAPAPAAAAVQRPSQAIFPSGTVAGTGVPVGPAVPPGVLPPPYSMNTQVPNL
ncbi:hypothetical protein C8F01DRAFT_1122009 [Mycena amicta]|nr:hypothetical protein C8F01DRAFT_1122009 [Mycena amicta]